ncbi:DUF5979 domain-containing protein [Microbacterium sp. Root180]|uniref:DUF5979 domain-containing protein n=1 Tax=Microbacterium sp. Root180 TaxID=1736483 RepID=UPI0006FDE8D9|nr:DUF5979 domain-containing protein [Microbacterium sp. Root180]KRB36610.1 hypothetical protein ASD93_11185 [Microbacterium sp. Root180]
MTTPADLRRTRRPIRTWMAALMALLTAIAGLAFAPTAAHAAEIDPVTNITITNPPPLHGETPYTFRADFAIPDSAVAGDTFTINFPQAVLGYSSTFDLLDAEGNVAGTCVVNDHSFVCTLSDYADTHVNITGHVDFAAKFVEEVDEDEVVFESENGVTYTVPTPGGVVIADRPVPTEVQKYGYLRANGSLIEWQIVVPGALLAPVDGSPVVITDHYDSALAFNPTTDAKVASLATSDWPDLDLVSWLAQGTTPGTFTVADRPAEDEFDVTINGPVTDGSRIYIIFVTMPLPAGVEDGDVFNNTASGTGFNVVAEPVEYVGSGGGVDGDGLGDFAVTKTVTGTGAGVVGGQDFTVEYSYDLAGEPITGELVVATGETAGLTDVPEGTVVTLSEVAPSMPGVVFGTPVFTGAGVTDNGGGTASFTITDEAAVAIGLENPATRVLGGLEVTKSVTGPGAGVVGDRGFTVEYSYDLDGEPVTGELVVANGETAALSDVPEGTVVTLSEVAPSMPGVVFGTPVFTGAGVTDNGDGTASFTITDEPAVAIALENPTTVPPGSPPPSLAATGSALPTGWAVGLAAALIGVGLVLAIGRRRPAQSGS